MQIFALLFLIFELTILVGVIIFTIAQFLAYEQNAPFIVTPPKRIKAMLALLEIKPGMKTVDLGSGDGRLVVALAKRGAQAHGVEINPLLVLYARLNAFLHNQQRTKFHWQSLFSIDLSGYDIITIYGFRQTLPKVQAKIEREIKPGTVVVSFGFPLSKKQPSHVGDGVFVYHY